MSNFLSSSGDPSSSVICTKINVTEGVPSSRWGHASEYSEGKLYIIGGRNEADINDLHEFDTINMKWKQVDINGYVPKARRRHSALVMSGSLIMFGGFDGSFFNDMHVLDLK